MKFSDLRIYIKNIASQKKFSEASKELMNVIFDLNKFELIPIITEIGSIPEDIEHDSSEEKLYTKVSDIILAKIFIELGLKSLVLTERANCADVFVESIYHNYSLVADAKAFRLSRTAKNQKDFKVESMVHWKKDNDYSVLCSPYFQYPKSKSQIYSSALEGNVSLFSWEYFYILLSENIKESVDCNLSDLWNYSKIASNSTLVSESQLSFLCTQNEYFCQSLGISNYKFTEYFSIFKERIVDRCQKEIKYWENEKINIKSLSREEAVCKLIKSLKLNEKINAINTYSNKLRGNNGNK